MHDSKMWKEKPKKQEREKQIKPQAHTAARCVWVCVCAYGWVWQQANIHIVLANGINNTQKKQAKLRGRRGEWKSEVGWRDYSKEQVELKSNSEAERTIKSGTAYGECMWNQRNKWKSSNCEGKFEKKRKKLKKIKKK